MPLKNVALIQTDIAVGKQGVKENPDVATAYQQTSGQSLVSD